MQRLTLSITPNFQPNASVHPPFPSVLHLLLHGPSLLWLLSAQCISAHICTCGKPPSGEKAQLGPLLFMLTAAHVLLQYLTHSATLA